MPETTIITTASPTTSDKLLVSVILASFFLCLPDERFYELKSEEHRAKTLREREDGDASHFNDRFQGRSVSAGLSPAPDRLLSIDARSFYVT